MIYITKLQIHDASFSGAHVLKKDLTIPCSSCVFLVGEQGTGKSTLLKMIKSMKGLKFLVSKNTDTNVMMYYFDSEKDNPRTVSDIENRAEYVVKSKIRSQGEVLKDLVFGMVTEHEKSIILLDEPETGLSIANQYLLKQQIKEATEKYACQFFIATHSPILIENEKVFSLEHNQEMTANRFISLAKKKALKK